MLIPQLQSRYYWVLALFFWFCMASFSLALNLGRLDSEVRDIALERSRIVSLMAHQAKAGPLLMQSDPGEFTHQVMEQIGYRIVSANPKKPANLADPWEIRALAAFSKAQDFLFERQDIQGEPCFRYIRPLFMRESCLSCHRGDGAKVGELRGGISVTVNARPIYGAKATNRRWILLTHLCGFLLLTGSTLFLLRQLRRRWDLLTETRDQLKRQGRFLSIITRTMGEGCVAIDRKGVVTFVNPECEWILGWEASSMLGRQWLDLVSPQSVSKRSDAQSALFRTLSDGITRREEGEVLLHKDGLLIPVAYAVSAMREEDEITGAVLTFNDISERNRAEEERSRMERQLNQLHKMEAVGQLAGGVAHEINTPIQYIRDNLRFLQETFAEITNLMEAYQALLMQAETIEALRPQVEKIKSVIEAEEFDYIKAETPKSIEQSLYGAEQVARIVLAMKEFAHPGSRQMEPADLNKIIRNAVAVSKNEWKYVADIALRLDPDLPQVVCLGDQIAQVVLNLIVNAAHAIEAAKLEGKGKILLISTLRGGQVEIRLADNGTGIPEAVRESIFNPFYTTKEVGKGTGQGLTIAQDIVVRKHRGRLFFETEEGRGTTFVMRLPFIQPGGGYADE